MKKRNVSNGGKLDQYARVSDTHVRRLVSLIRLWPVNRRLTWGKVIEWGAEHCGHTWVRQTLCVNPELREAYDAHAKKRESYKGRRSNEVPESQAIADRIRRLEVEKAELQKTLAQYDEKFIRYIGNALRYGISQEKLEAPLVHINRRAG